METSTSPHFAVSQHRHPPFRNHCSFEVNRDQSREVEVKAEAEAKAQGEVEEEAKNFMKDDTMKTGTGMEER
eukprot:scaffold9464_cov25-Attheya_sp.AAC.3